MGYLELLGITLIINTICIVVTGEPFTIPLN